MDKVGLSELKIPIQKVAPLTRFYSRGGVELGYRLYKSWSENLIILIHGVGGDSRYLTRLASALAEKGVGCVVTPDLRGHGEIPHPARASVSSLDQLEQDMEEILVHVRMNVGAQRILWGGHSLGASLALKMALAPGGFWTKGCLMIAPYFSPDFKLNEPDFGGWLKPEGDLIKVNMPEEFRTGSEVLEYDTAFFTAATPVNLIQRWQQADWPTEVILAKDDAILNAERTQEFIQRLFPKVKTEILPGSHLGVVANLASIDGIVKVAQSLL